MSSRSPSNHFLCCGLSALTFLWSGTMALAQAHDPQPTPETGAMYDNEPAHIAAGALHFRTYNCVGCHFHGGGGIGPAFLDGTWHHGGSMVDIFKSIHDGHADGMPTWHGVIPEEEIWQLAAFVKSLESKEERPDGPPPAVEAQDGALDAEPRSSRRAEN